MNMPQNAIYLTGFYKQLKCSKKSYDRLCFVYGAGAKEMGGYIRVFSTHSQRRARKETYSRTSMCVHLS